MPVVAYGTEKAFILSTAFENFMDVEDIRKSYYNYDTVVVIDDAVERILGIDTLISFGKAINPSMRFILFYQNTTLEAYTDLFDVSYNINIDALDANLAEQLVSGIRERDSLLTTLEETNADLVVDVESLNPLQGIVPSSLPSGRGELIDIINNLSDALISTSYTTRRTISANKRLKDMIHRLLTYKDGMLQNTHLTKKVNERLATDNLYLKSFKEEVLLTTPRHKDNVIYTNHNIEDIITVHIKEIDPILFTHKFLELLTTKITYSLGLPTKFYILDDLSVRASHSPLTIIYDSFTKPTIYSSVGAIKVGYSEEFMDAIYADKSQPKVIVIFNSVAGLTLDTKSTINYYATKGDPNRYPSLTNEADNTITNYPDRPMSYSYRPEFKEMQGDAYTQDYLLHLPVFNNIVEDIKYLQDYLRQQAIKEKMEAPL